MDSVEEHAADVLFWFQTEQRDDSNMNIVIPIIAVATDARK